MLISICSACERTREIPYKFDEVDPCVIFINGYVESYGDEISIPSEFETDTIVHGIPINRNYFTISRIFIGQTTQLNEPALRRQLLNIDATISRNSDKPLPLFFERQNKAYEVVYRSDYFMPGDTVTLRVVPKDPKSELKPISAVTIIPPQVTATPSNAQWVNNMAHINLTFDYNNRSNLDAPPALAIDRLAARHNGDSYFNYTRFWSGDIWHTNNIGYADYAQNFIFKGKRFTQMALYRTNNPADWPHTCTFSIADESCGLKESDNFTISFFCSSYSEEYYQNLEYSKIFYDESMYNPFVNATGSYTSVHNGAGVFYSKTQGQHFELQVKPQDNTTLQ